MKLITIITNKTWFENDSSGPSVYNLHGAVEGRLKIIAKANVHLYLQLQHCH